jgi:hypothetical protein
MALARAAGPDDQHRRLLVQVAPGGQVVHQGPVELGQPLEVELLQRLGGSELRPAQPGAELLLLAPGHLVADQQRQEVGVGQLGLDGLAVAGFQRVEDAGQAQLLQLRCQLGGGVHSWDFSFGSVQQSSCGWGKSSANSGGGVKRVRP